MVAPAIDAKLYALFERVVREARPADVYSIKRSSERPNGGTYLENATLGADEKHLLPWGQVDAIRSVEWYPGGRRSGNGPFRTLYQGDGRCVRITCSDFNGGIMVHSSLMAPVYPMGVHNARICTEIAGVLGIVRNLANCVPYADEDAVVARVLEVIKTAYEVFDFEQEMRAADEVYEY